MAKYIDADLLRKDIESAKSVYSNPKRVVHGVADAFRQDGRAAMCDDILKKLDSLPEQPVEWEDEYREEDLRTRFAFYTYKNEEDDGVLYLSNVFVEEASRNAGFGTKILEAAEKVAETIGAITICLKVKQDSPANAWYRKHGYGYIAFEGEYDWLEKNLEYLKPKRKEQPVEGLEEELEKEIDRFEDWMETYNQADYPTSFTTRDIARHFAEWQKKLDDLETADLLAIAHLQGMEQQKNKMLEEAVEGEIQMRYSGCLCAKTIRAINEDKFKLGDKVRVIVIKEDK